MNCKNCNEIIEHNFCSHCGQKSSVSRLTFSSFLNDLFESLFQINKGFFFTLKALFISPGKSIKDFLNGKRKNHFKPIAYVVALSTIYFIVSKLVNQSTWMNNFVSGFSNGAKDTGVDNDLLYFLTWLSDNFAYATLIYTPIFSLGTYLTFFNYRKNYIEHIVINAYITGQQAIIYSFFLLLNAYFDNEILESIPVFLSLGYAFWVYWQIFNNGNRILNLLRSALAYIIYFVCFFVLSFVFAIILLALGVDGFH